MNYDVSCSIILCLEKWDPRTWCLDDMVLALVFCFQRMVSEVETQTNGIVVIVDVKDLALHHVRQFTPSMVKKIANITQVKFK